MKNDLDVYYGLPSEVKFCKRCVYSNQKPNSTIEFKHNSKTKKRTVYLDDDGICDACKYAEDKENIDWSNRENELLQLLEKYRRNDGYYDCIVPSSGGKDSAFASHIIKYKYGMNPLTITWPPILYTDYGYRNFKNWIDIGGFDNLSFTRNGKVMKLLTKLSIENLLHPFLTFIIGQKLLAPKISIKYDIPLILYGENPAEYGNAVVDNKSSLMQKYFWQMDHLDEIYLGGVTIRELKEKYGVSMTDLMCFIPPSKDDVKNSIIDFRYLGYYLKWTPQENYYYAVENTGFQARPFRSEGTYSKYSSFDDKIDDLHYYTHYIKFGLGRATFDSSQEIYNNHLTRDEAKALVKRFDGEFPKRYFNDVMEYLEMDPEYFHSLCDKFRSPHLWGKVNNDWKLRHTVNKDGIND